MPFTHRRSGRHGPGLGSRVASVEVWEMAALGSGLLAAVGAHALRARLQPLLERLRGYEHPWAWDVVLVGLGMLWNVPALLGAWRVLSPHGSPMGPDSDMNFFAAIALQRGDLEMYGQDRYPAFAWLAATFADGLPGIPAAGMRLSMLAALALGPAAYALGRQLGGRAAGFAALTLVLRLPGVADLGRQFTPYAMVAAIDLVAVVALVALLSGGGRMRVGLAAVALVVCTALAFSSEPKQLPVALLLVAMGAPLLVLRDRWVGGVGALALLGTIPALNRMLAAAQLPIFSLEEITSRVQLGLVVDPALGTQGWSPGEPLAELFRSLYRVATLVHPTPGQGLFHRYVAEGLRMQMPDTSLVWAMPALGLLLFRGPAPRHALLGLLPLSLVAWSTLHLHFQHRYALAFVVVLPVLAAAGLARAGGAPAVLATLAVAVLLPGSPWRGVAPRVTERVPNLSDSWAGREPPEWVAKAAEADEKLAADGFVLDYGQSRPWTMLAAARPFVRCTATHDTCRSQLGRPGTLYAVLWPGEQVSIRDAPGAAALEGAVAAPEQVGECWTRVMSRPENGGVYQWTCAQRPVPPTR